MQRIYRERKYTCGDYIEVAIYPVYTQQRGRSKRKKPTSEVQQRLNHRHATDRLRFEQDGLSALAVYLTKGNDDEGDRLTFKRWSGSRNLEQPTITERDGRISHKKMIDFCERDSDSAIYLETHYDGFETVENSPIFS